MFTWARSERRSHSTVVGVARLSQTVCRPSDGLSARKKNTRAGPMPLRLQMVLGQHYGRDRILDGSCERMPPRKCFTHASIELLTLGPQEKFLLHPCRGMCHF